jgi:hypothetical protein
VGDLFVCARGTIQRTDRADISVAGLQPAGANLFEIVSIGAPLEAARVCDGDEASDVDGLRWVLVGYTAAAVRRPSLDDILKRER